MRRSRRGAPSGVTSHNWAMGRSRRGVTFNKLLFCAPEQTRKVRPIISEHKACLSIAERAFAFAPDPGPTNEWEEAIEESVAQQCDR